MSALTKMLIVLTLVFSLVTSVVLVLGVSKMDPYKSQADDANTARIALSASLAEANRQGALQTAALSDKDKQVALANEAKAAAESGRNLEKAQLEADILGLKSQIATLTATGASQTAANGTLSATNSALTNELQTVRPMVAKGNTENQELTRALNEANNQLRAAEQAIRKLQEQQVAGTGPSGAVAPMGSEGQVATMGGTASATGKVNGQISEVNTSTGSTIIGLPLGTRDGIEPNTKLLIYRGNGYVGDAVVQRATPDESVALVVSTKQGAVVQKGDLVSTVGQ